MKSDKKMRKLDRGNALAISAIVLCFMLTIVFAGFFNGGGFLSALSWKEDGLIYYAVSCGCYDDILLARQDADLVRERGGAGFVLKKDEVYHLLLSIYKEKSDADSVLEKQSSGSYIVEIFSSEYDYTWCQKSQKNAVEQAVLCFDSTYLTLFEIGNNFDKGTLNQIDAVNQIVVQLGKVEVAKSNLLNAGCPNCDEYLNLQCGLAAVIALLNILQGDRGSNNTFSASIRYTSISIILTYVNLNQI